VVDGAVGGRNVMETARVDGAVIEVERRGCDCEGHKEVGTGVEKEGLMAKEDDRGRDTFVDGPGGIF